MEDIIKNLDEIILFLKEELQKLAEWNVDGIFESVAKLVKKVTNWITLLINHKMELENNNILIDENIILNNLKNMMAAIEARDVVFLQDTLEYEVLYMFEEYQKIFKGVQANDEQKNM